MTTIRKLIAKSDSNKLKSTKKIRKVKDPTVEISFTYPLAVEFKKAFDVFLKGDGTNYQMPFEIQHSSRSGFKTLQLFNRKLAKALEKYSFLQRFPTKRFNIAVKQSYGRSVFLSLYVILVQMDCTNHTMVKMKKHDPIAFKSLKKLLEKVRWI